LKHANGRLFYEYDFGDSWVHSIEAAPGANHLEGRVARLIYAEGRCPFEDVGGTSGWLAFKEAVADPSLPRAAELRSWAGLSPDPTDRFDPDEVDTESITRGIDLLAMLEQPGFGPGSFGHALVDGIDRSVAVKFLGDTAWDAPLDPLSDDQLTKFIRPVQWLIRRIGEGIKLTSAGWLPTALVAEAAAEFGVPDWSPQAAKTESKNIPLQELRGTMTRSRLLRRDQGWLRPTRAALAAADHPSAMFDLFAARFRPGGRRSDRAAAIALAAMLLQVQAGHGQNSERVGEAILEALGCHDYWFECNPNEAGNYAFGMVYPEWRTLLALAEPWTMEGCAWPFAEPAVKHFARQVLASPA
ncbi:MAG: plasmid pRiA4b ORF-3 family protein, partial [Bifidobacteriaceae bacterium]|nr:plasmid pRiA4b ORF-3 family protein [Bifidobacteriaceae bacterium]